MNCIFCIIVLTGLDVPLYCVINWPNMVLPKLRINGPVLRTSNAKFVDTIRTSFLSGLVFQKQGHADFHVDCNVVCSCGKYNFIVFRKAITCISAIELECQYM